MKPTPSGKEKRRRPHRNTKRIQREKITPLQWYQQAMSSGGLVHVLSIANQCRVGAKSGFTSQFWEEVYKIATGRFSKIAPDQAAKFKQIPAGQRIEVEG